jgi:cytochrome oxidase Cu insertion factor (SCO1/SenC/PrrC family)
MKKLLATLLLCSLSSNAAARDVPAIEAPLPPLAPWKGQSEKVPLPGGDFTIDHTASIFLMDRNGELVSTIDNHEDPEIAMEKLEKLVTC